MYLAINKTKGIISISDLGVVLNRRQMIDLDKIKTLIPPEKSKDLKTCVRSGKVKVKHDRNTVKPEPAAPAIDQDNLLSDLKDSMKEEIQKQFKQLQITGDAGNSSNSPAEMKQLLAMMQQMMVNQQNTGGLNGPEPDMDDGLDDGVMSDIHAKAIDKLDKSTEAEITNEKSKVKGDDLLDNADELEGLV